MTETSEARVRTAKAARYLSQLVKHFAHRLEATQDGRAGRLAFPFGTCTLEADPDLLVLRAEAADEPTLARLEEVVARHLERFAFREELSIVWNRAATQDPATGGRAGAQVIATEKNRAGA